MAQNNDGQSNKSVYRCINCGYVDAGGKYCSNCSTKALRDKMQKENAEVQKRLTLLQENKEWIYKE